ncbi:MAG: hypothetical protein HY020_24260 [Burkholderiales bacterium]|nr:hypothetical protein [Burkholderiales bacterium]
MYLNLNDADSIVAWWQVMPERHQSYLEYKLHSSPEFAPAILEAKRRISSNPALRGLLSAAVRDRRAWQALSAEHEGFVSSLTLRDRELAAVA